MRLFKKKPPPPTALERVQTATDELNAAMVELRKDEDYRNIRPWVRSGDARTKLKAKVMLGYWDTGSQQFVVIYGSD